MVAATKTLVAASTAVEGLFNSEHRYFAAGSINKKVLQGMFSVVPGYSRLPAACVMHTVDENSLPANVGQWTQALERLFCKHGASLCRLYVSNETRALQRDLSALGYQSVTEIGLHIKLHPNRYTHWYDAQLRRVDPERDWERKLQLYVDARDGPDGHDMQSGAYAALERVKCEAGYMRSYLYWHGDQPVAAVSLAISDGYARLKNLLVHPDHRGRGVGLRLVRALFAEAARNGAIRMGAFAGESGAGGRLYRRCGLTEITYQTEWTKPI